MYLRWQARKLAAYEAWVAGQFEGLFVNATTDALALQAMAPRFAGRIHVAANGVDPHLLSSKPGGAEGSAKLVFVGHMAYPPNIEAVLWFAQHVLPRILAVRPDATFEVVGGDAPPQILGLAGKPGVRLHGYQPDTLPYLAAAALSVCPVLTGAGRQNKLMEAFAYGLPGGGHQAGGSRRGSGGRQTPAGRRHGGGLCPSGAFRLLQEPALGRRLAKEAARLVKSKYDWARNARQLESVLVSQSR